MKRTREAARARARRGRRRNERITALSRAKCQEKLLYTTEAGARTMARIYRQRAYRCPVCKGWHLTSGR